MGFTLRAALAVLGPEARIVVAELVPAVLAWARGSMVEVFGTSLTDPRVRIRESDVGHLIRSGRSTFDAILLDVDNGPAGLTVKAMTRCTAWRDCAPLARRCVPVAYSRCGHRDLAWISLSDFARG
jgi:spermidine synthase